MELEQQVTTLLMDLIRIPSVRGGEGPAARYMAEAMAPLVDDCRLVPIDDALMDDPDYAFRLPGHTYRDTPNLECVIRGAGRGPAVVLNTHLDVVPPSEGQVDAFNPTCCDGVVFGRGACDAKGQVATVYALALLMQAEGRRPAGDVTIHFVVEEECGGNGTLAMMRRGVRAGAAVVLEPTGMAVVPAVRGALWFELEVRGRAAHSGSAEGRISALDKAFQAIEILRRYHDRLLAESRGQPLFDAIADPMPLTIGECHAGAWPSIVPAQAVLRGLLGFLPNKQRSQVKAEMQAALRNEGDAWLRDNFELRFPMLHNDGNAIPAGHPLPAALLSALERHGVEPRAAAMPAACDAWRYNNQAGIPTVVFGPGALADAHTVHEQIRVQDVLCSAAVLLDFLMSPIEGAVR